MSLKKLEDEGFIKPYKAGKDQIKAQVELFSRDFLVAKNTQNYDWAFSILYNAILQAGRALVFSFNYRISDKEPHKTVFKFLRAVMDKDELDVLDFFDKMRVKRHQAVYDHIGIISKKELDYAFKLAEKFLSKIKKSVGW